MRSITLRAFAKINLSLRVKEARPDGFHELQTILQAIDLFDRVTCGERAGRSRSAATAGRADRSDEPRLESGAAAVARRGARRRAARRGRHARKEDPGAGGSGRRKQRRCRRAPGLATCVEAARQRRALYAIAAELGSDVPYFLVGGTALGLGRGEEVYPLEDLPRLWVVLVLPPFGVTTRDAYGGWTTKGVGCHFRRCTRKAPDPFWLSAGGRRNDLEGPVIERHPVIGR